MMSHFENICFAKGAWIATDEELQTMDAAQMTDRISDMLRKSYEKKEAQYGSPVMRELERVITLRVVDEYWMDHIDAMDDLRQGIRLRAYAQTDPVIEYKREGFDMFEAMNDAIKEEIVRRVFLVRIKTNEEIKRQRVAKVTGESAGSDGTVWLYEQMNIYRFNLPEGLDTTVENQYDYYESGPSSSALIQLSADGEVLNRIDVAQENENGGSFYLNYFIVDSNGYIYAGNWEKILVWDKDENQIASLDNDDGGQLVQYSADKVGLLTNGETHGVKVFDPVKKDWGETIELPTFAYDIQPGDDVYDFFYDYNGKIYGYISETGTAEKVVDWMECDVDSNNMQAYKILPDGRVFAFTQKWTQDGTQTQFILLSRVDAATLPEKTTLTLACMYMDYNLRSQIVNFNRRNSQYRIVVKDYSEYNTEDDYNAGLTKLTTEIASGAMPDILVTDQLPVSRYAAKGLLQDLWPFIDADTEISRDDLVTEVLDALSIDGRLYALPASFSICTVAGLEKVVGEYDTWTLADLRDAMTKLQPGATIFGEGVTKDNILENCVSASFDELIDWETGTCSFDGETFRELLEFANEFPAEFDYENSDMYDTYESDYSRMRSGKQLLTNQGFYGFDDLYVTRE